MIIENKRDMNNIKAINSIQDFHHQLDDFITSIDAIKNQNLDYEVLYKDWTKTKDFTIVQQENESVEQVKERAETALDQIYELNKRNNLIIEGMNEFLPKFEEFRECCYLSSLVGLCFLHTLNIPERLCKEPASVVGPQGRGGCWDEKGASFFNFLKQSIFTWLT